MEYRAISVGYLMGLLASGFLVYLLAVLMAADRTPGSLVLLAAFMGLLCYVLGLLTRRDVPLGPRRRGTDQ